MDTLIVILSLLVCILSVSLFLEVNKCKKTNMFDFQTGLGNKKYFSKQYHEKVEKKHIGNYYLTHISFDLRRVNEDFGVEQGEIALKETASILTNSLEENEFAARISGASFVFAFIANTNEGAKKRVNKIIEELNSNGMKYSLNYRAGIFPLAGKSVEFQYALNSADKCYRQAVKTNIPVLLCLSDTIAQLTLEEKIKNHFDSAIKNREFVPHMQYIVSAHDSKSVGIEMLSRWQSKQLGMLPPGLYIPVLEKNNLIDKLDCYMFEEACKILETWKDNDLFVSCNFSRISLSSKGFADRIIEIGNKYDIDKSRFVIEITEESLESSKSIILENLLSYKKEGYLVALDDLGSGYASLINLCHYPLDVAKIDRSIVIEACKSDMGRQILHFLTKVSHERGLLVICEGVENKQEDDIVRNAYIDCIQGFLYSRVTKLN